MEKNELKPKSLEERLNILKNEVVPYEEQIQGEMTRFFKGQPKYIVFLSVSNGRDRARVVHSVANTIEAAWKNAVNLLKKVITKAKIKAHWVKADLVTDITTHTYQGFLKHVSNIRRNYFREGISLDPMFNTAFLEQEVNANAFLHGLKEKKAYFAFNNINFYMNTYQDIRFPVKEKHIEQVYTFKTKSFFVEEQNHYELHDGVLSNGCRKIEHIDSEFVESIINQTSKFLAGEVLETGQFRYGYFPAFDKEINTYNILRHGSTTYSMVEAYEITGDKELRTAIEKALQFLIDDAIKFVVGEDGVERAFVIEKSLDNEIKLGANAAAILAFAKYTTVIGDKQYIPLMEQLAEGILYFQDAEKGSFIHVLNYPDLSVKDEFRTIYYDGEAAFALMRLYEITHEVKWLEAVEKGFEHFIEADHWKHGDHWLSYCSNELFTYRPERKYADFNLKNANRMLNFSLTRETAFPTLLELMMASYNMIVKMKEQNLHLDLLDSFDEAKLNQVIEHRVKHQLNSYFYPEMAMYFKAPNKILHSFYIRHHSYRVRIDDVEHNLSGYCSYYHNVLMREDEFGQHPTEVKLEKQEESVEKLQPETTDDVEMNTLSNRPLIGMLRQFKRPNKLVRVAALEAEKLNCDFIFFHPEDINFKNQTISGQVYRNGKWEKQISRLPDAVDNSPSRKAYREIYKKLEEFTPLTMRRIGNKDVIAKRLIEQRMFANMVIPYEEVSSVQQVMDYLEQYNQIIIKPSGGNQGKGIHFLMKQENEYVWHDNNEAYLINHAELIEELNEIAKSHMIVQPFITSMTKEGRPFDIRVHIRRNGQGEWQLVKMYPRVGKLGSIVSNVSQGGYIGDLQEVLQENFGDEKASAMEAELKAFATLFPERFQRGYDKPLDALGIDIGVDSSGELWMFEVNSFPGSTGFEEESQSVAMAYAKYLAENIKGITSIPNGYKRNDDSKIVIGMLSPVTGTSKLKANCADAAKVHDCEFMYFTPKDIDYENRTVIGKVRQGFSWKNKEYSLLHDVDVVYDRIRRIGTNNFMDVYKAIDHLPITHPSFGKSVSKLSVYNILKNESKLSSCIIPYENVVTLDGMLKFLYKHEEIIIKPHGGLGGKNLYYISYKDSQYKIIVNNNKKILNRMKLEEWFNESINKNQYVIQKYIDTRTIDNQPFDIRVHLVRNEKNQLRIAALYPRVGVGYEKITPTSMGGYIGSFEGFIKRNFGKEKYTKINKAIRSLSMEIIRGAEKSYQTIISEAGIDFAISSSGDVYLLELNLRRPGIIYYEYDVAKNMIGYAKYLAQSKSNSNKKE